MGLSFYAGKPRIVLDYEMMKRFKLALRYCKRNEEQLRCDALASEYLSDKGNFCYLPVDLLKTTIVPLLKNKAGDITDVTIELLRYRI